MAALQAPALGPPARVLVVEDDPQVAELLRQLLVEEGYHVEHVADGAEGIARVARGELDLVLLDVMLPSVDGLEVCRRVRAAAPADALYLPILMLTVLATPADRRAGFAAGADDYLPKPFDPPELLARIRVWLRWRRQVETCQSAVLRQQAALYETRQQVAEARLEGVRLAARELAHRLNNNLALSVAVLDLLQTHPAAPADLLPLTRDALERLQETSDAIARLQRIARVETRETPWGRLSTSTAPFRARSPASAAHTLAPPSTSY